MVARQRRPYMQSQRNPTPHVGRNRARSITRCGERQGPLLGCCSRRRMASPGVEFAGRAEAARTMFDVDVIAGDFLTTAFQGSFDVITMWHTLEHLPDPGAALARSSELLRPDGCLIISVPNASSAQARLGGDAWFHLDLPRHLFQFGPRSISALLSRSGFRLERMSSISPPEMEAIGLIQTVLNRVGLRHVLYRFAKRDNTVSRGLTLAASFGLAAALTPAALVWSLFAPRSQDRRQHAIDRSPGPPTSITLIRRLPRPGVGVHPDGR